MSWRAGVTKRILIVDDDVMSRKLARDVLAAHGYEVEEAVDGEQALEHARVRWPDLVVMDIALPGIDGLETTRRLKAMPGGRDVPVLAVTAHAMTGDDGTARDAGCDGYMAKPLRFADLVSEVTRLFAERSTH